MTNLTLTAVDQHFEALGTENGLNKIQENPCSLLDFALLRLGEKETWQGNSGDNEVMAVILGGKCSIAVKGGSQWENIGKRPNVFSGKPYAVYVPPQTDFSVYTTGSKVEVALCYAKAKQNQPAPRDFLITPKDVDDG